jgi:hypothetical protein
VLEDTDREAILALSKEFLFLASHLRVEVNFAPALGVGISNYKPVLRMLI